MFLYKNRKIILSTLTFVFKYSYNSDIFWWYLRGIFRIQIDVKRAMGELALKYINSEISISFSDA